MATLVLTSAATAATASFGSGLAASFATGIDIRGLRKKKNRGLLPGF